MPTEADKKLAEEFIASRTYFNVEGFVKDACAEAIEFARKRFEEDETAKQPPEKEAQPLPDKLPAHCFAVVECDDATYHGSSDGYSFSGFAPGCDVVMKFSGADRMFPVPAGSFLFIPTGEVRVPNKGEWVVDYEGTVRQSGGVFIDQHKILHCIKVV